MYAFMYELNTLIYYYSHTYKLIYEYRQILSGPLRTSTKAYQSSLGASSTPTYLYDFKHVLSFDPWGGRTFCRNASCHAAELPFVFNIFGDYSSGGVRFSPRISEKILAMGMNNAWANFISSGNPNPSSTGGTVPVTFPKYDSSYGDEVAVLDVGGFAVVAQGMAGRDDFCDLWDSIGYSNLW